jgi:regulatory helix-turn-helix LysR family protein
VNTSRVLTALSASGTVHPDQSTNVRACETHAGNQQRTSPPTNTKLTLDRGRLDVIHGIRLAGFSGFGGFWNFSRAAELRHVTQPAFSRRIRALEDWVGVDLFERDSHPVMLTEASRRFRPVAEELLRHHPVANCPSQQRQGDCVLGPV